MLRERGKFYQVSRRDWFQRLPRLLPSRYSADEYERIESLFPQLQRHTGAGGFACSSTVDVNVMILRESLEFLGKVIWFKANGAFDARRTGIVIAMAADVQYQNFVFFF